MPGSLGSAGQAGGAQVERPTGETEVGQLGHARVVHEDVELEGHMSFGRTEARGGIAPLSGRHG